MIAVILDGEKLRSDADVHDILSRAFNFPPYYGRNLDALWDCLTEFCEPICVRFINYDSAAEHLGGFAAGLKALFEDAQNAIAHFSFEIGA